MTKGYEKKNLSRVTSPNSKPSNASADKADIALLTQKIQQKLIQDPQGPTKAGKILSDWLNLESTGVKKPLKKAG